MKALPHTKISVIPQHLINFSNNILYIYKYNPFFKCIWRNWFLLTNLLITHYQIPSCTNQGEEKNKENEWLHCYLYALE